MEKFTIITEKEGIPHYSEYETPGIEYAYTKAMARLPEGHILVGVVKSNVKQKTVWREDGREYSKISNPKKYPHWCCERRVDFRELD